ncbi:MAG: nucleoside deaminase [Bacteroidia bacterium]|nr:nucleoside deaminase [Bacteroidia bacterium]
MNSTFNDDYFMRKALIMAEQAYREKEVPIGAVIVYEHQIVGKGYNQTEKLQDPTAHAEMIAITAACDYIGSRVLQDCTLYVTVEPCVMCAGAIKWSQIGRLVYGASEPKSGFSLYSPTLLHPKTKVSRGIMMAECADLMRDFFFSKRG